VLFSLIIALLLVIFGGCQAACVHVHACTLLRLPLWGWGAQGRAVPASSRVKDPAPHLLCPTPPPPHPCRPDPAV
jgi:hypothetical protein